MRNEDIVEEIVRCKPIKTISKKLWVLYDSLIEERMKTISKPFADNWSNSDIKFHAKSHFPIIALFFDEKKGNNPLGYFRHTISGSLSWYTNKVSHGSSWLKECGCKRCIWLRERLVFCKEHNLDYEDYEHWSDEYKVLFRMVIQNVYRNCY